MNTRTHEPLPLGVQIRCDTAILNGDLTVVEGALGTVLFAHGSGSGRSSPRNRFVAHVLHQARLSTLLLDLLTDEEDEAEDRGAQRRFDIELLAERVATATRWLLDEPSTREVPIGYFGSSTGAAAALQAAASLQPGLFAIVSRGGRPDYVPGSLLARVEAPTLLVVGSLDTDVLALNRRAFRHLGAPRKQIEVIPGASHLFDEPGTLERVAELARDWFLRYLSPEEIAHGYLRDAEEVPGEQREDGKGLFQLADQRRWLFADRSEAGTALAMALDHHRNRGAVVVGIARGGVPVAYEVARQLHCDLDVIVARKLGAPGQEELAIGAVTSDGTRVLNERVIEVFEVSEEYLARVTAEQSAEARRREERFRGGRRPIDLTGKVVIVVDDGVATGATIRAVIRAMQHAKAQKVVIAVPVGSASACSVLAREADELVCPHRPDPFNAVGAHYRSFEQTSDEDVVLLLERHRREREGLTRARLHELSNGLR